MKIDLDREAAYKALLAIERDGSYSNLKLSKMLESDGLSNKGFIREIVYGVTENKIYMDYILDKFIKKGAAKTKLQALIILRMGVYQILFMNSVPNYAAVNESVALARRFARGTDGFINGVLRNFIRNMDSASEIDVQGQLEYLSIRYSCQLKLVEELVSMLGFEHAKMLLEHAGHRPPLSIRVNIAKISVKELADRLRAKGFEIEGSKLSDRVLLVKGGALTEANEYKEGLFSIQSEESCAIADFADAKPTELVIDLCAAPGGKAAAMAEQMLKPSTSTEPLTETEPDKQPSTSTEPLTETEPGIAGGKVVALELYEHRAALIEATARRLGLENIEVRCQNAVEQIDALVGKADLVLADVPCSGLGVIRRKPEMKYRDEFDFDELVEIQKSILETGSSYLKPGGRLIYSTCTINPRENELMVKDFLERHEEFISEKEVKLSPFDNGYDGFYMNKLKKIEGRCPNGCGV
ncbi:MAG: 16S rRNA (cytosine(967)-C(5))-methyltransferase RsmB [[Eubacterium] sulci]|nr:16S rRNA (cytosine(967)-C(5))-methyltransferase RsmB [[Eubacterium] sulci]